MKAPHAAVAPGDSDGISLTAARRCRLPADVSYGSGIVPARRFARQIIARAVAPEGVVDTFEVAGLYEPDISILSEDFLADVKELGSLTLSGIDIGEF